MANTENTTYRVKTDGFYGELFRPENDKFPGKALICFSGSDGGIELARALAGVYQAQGLTTLALAYVLEEDLPDRFVNVPIDTLEAAAKRLHEITKKSGCGASPRAPSWRWKLQACCRGWSMRWLLFRR